MKSKEKINSYKSTSKKEKRSSNPKTNKTNDSIKQKYSSNVENLDYNKEKEYIYDFNENKTNYSTVLANIVGNTKITNPLTNLNKPKIFEKSKSFSFVNNYYTRMLPNYIKFPYTRYNFRTRVRRSALKLMLGISLFTFTGLFVYGFAKGAGISLFHKNYNLGNSNSLSEEKIKEAVRQAIQETSMEKKVENVETNKNN